MLTFLPGAVFSGLATVAFVIVLRLRAGRPRLPVWALALIAIAAAFVIPWALALSAAAWRAAPALPALPTITFDQVFIGVLVALAVLTGSHRPNRRPRLPLWAGLLSGRGRRHRAAAAPRPDVGRLSAAFAARRRQSLHARHAGEIQPREVANICDEPIAVGLCLPGETNPAPCAQTAIIQPGASAQFDPGDATLSSLPSNLDGLTASPAACPTGPRACRPRWAAAMRACACRQRDRALGRRIRCCDGDSTALHRTNACGRRSLIERG